MKNRKKNLFRDCGRTNLYLSNHFLERWNKRVGTIKFDTKKELRDYIQRNYDQHCVEHLHGDHYLIDNILGGVYVTACRVKSGILLITTLGTYKENPIIYNMITSGEFNETLIKYGKVELGYAA